MRRHSLVVLAICLISVLGWLWLPDLQPSPFTITHSSEPAESFPVYSILLYPKYEKWHTKKNIDDTDYVWQIPSNPQAVLFLAHGCSRHATVFWDRHPQCPNCVGLPEERALLLQALERGFAVIAISSTDVCWSVKDDMEPTKVILSDWILEKGLKQLPVVGLGSSTGGYFLSVFAHQFKFHALVLMVAEGQFGEVQNRTYYPPVLFVHMPKDEARAEHIKFSLELLKMKGVEAEDERCMELPVLSDFFTQRIPGVDNDTSRRMVGVLQQSGCVDDRGFVKQDSRWFDWDFPFKKQGILAMKQDPRFQVQVQEELNIAFGFHEFTSLPSERIFAWFSKHINSPTTKR